MEKLNVLIQSSDWDLHDYFQRIIESSNSRQFDINIVKAVTDEERDEYLDVQKVDLMLWDLRGGSTH